MGLFQNDSRTPAIKGIVSSVVDVVGGGVVGTLAKGITSLFGGVPESVKEEGRALAAKFNPAGVNATSLPINPTTIQRYNFPDQPVDGEFHIWRQTGEVFSVTSYAGMVKYPGTWADSVRQRFNQLYDPKTNKILTWTEYNEKSRGGISTAGSMPVLLMLAGFLLTRK